MKVAGESSKFAIALNRGLVDSCSSVSISRAGMCRKRKEKQPDGYKSVVGRNVHRSTHVMRRMLLRIMVIPETFPASKNMNIGGSIWCKIST